jgi:hypothetical protein
MVWSTTQTLTAPKIAATINHVRLCGVARPPPRTSAANRNPRPTTASMYFAATADQLSFASSRCCRQAGALVLNSGVPGSRRQR